MEGEFEVVAVRWRAGFLACLLALAWDAPCHSDEIGGDCSGWRVMKIGGIVLHMSADRKGAAIAVRECLMEGNSIRTFDTGQIVIQKGTEILEIPAQAICVIDSPPMVFRESWMKVSLKSTQKMMARKSKYSAQEPSQVAGVRGASRADAQRSGDIQWFGSDDDEGTQTQDLERTYQKLKQMRAETSDTEVRNRLILYLADMAVLLLRPDEARDHLRQIPATSRVYPEARKRLGL